MGSGHLVRHRRATSTSPSFKFNGLRLTNDNAVVLEKGVIMGIPQSRDRLVFVDVTHTSPVLYSSSRSFLLSCLNLSGFSGTKEVVSRF